ncbi:hypothetical protein [Bacillus velezensis]|uniref:hypothetical protein n=1 Tax=Bacillus velezensis TaxID=492670 RepID=UPI0024943F75|nr:hypothetical protein [Bacillus velezensis]
MVPEKLGLDYAEKRHSAILRHSKSRAEPFSVVKTSTPELREKWLRQAYAKVRRACEKGAAACR